MVGRRAIYDEAVQKNDKDMAQSIKDASVVRSLPTTAWQVAIGMCFPPHIWSTNSLQLDQPPALSTANTAMILRVKRRGCSPLNFPWFPIKTQYQKDSSFSRCVPHVILPIPTARNPWPRDRANKRPPRSHVLLARRRVPLHKLPLKSLHSSQEEGRHSGKSRRCNRKWSDIAL
jgi:hypothetical protein